MNRLPPLQMDIFLGEQLVAAAALGRSLHKHLLRILLTITYRIVLERNTGMIVSFIFLHLQHGLVRSQCLTSGSLLPSDLSKLPTGPLGCSAHPSAANRLPESPPGVGDPSFDGKGVQTALHSQCEHFCNASHNRCEYSV